MDLDFDLGPRATVGALMPSHGCVDGVSVFEHEFKKRSFQMIYFDNV